VLGSYSDTDAKIKTKYPTKNGGGLVGSTNDYILYLIRNNIFNGFFRVQVLPAIIEGVELVPRIIMIALPSFGQSLVKCLY